jgi:alpha-tubulin suppressor-like RCC1 family protein
MKKNLVQKILPVSYATWTAPAGVEEVIVTVLDKFDDLEAVGKDTTAYGLRKTGAAFAWGLGTSGQLGDATIVSKSTPVPVTGGLSFVQLAAGQGHAVALRSDGNAYAWGIGTGGQLGNSAIINTSAPVLVAGSHSFVQISAGSANSGAIKADGSAWTWGTNTTGALGTGTITTTSTPVPVIGGHSFVRIVMGDNAVTIGSNFAGGLKSNGQLWTWGTNTNGQLGDNTVVNKSSPVQVVGGHSFIQFAMGSNHVIALKSNGEAWTWGQNNAGQLGNGLSDVLGTENRSSPIQVIGGHSFVKVAAGLLTSAALKTDGSVWTWGNNVSGQLGVGNNISRSSPVQVIGGHSFVSVDAGGNTMIALKSNSQLWSWGVNNNGQLGDNTIVNKSSPVQIVTGFTFEAGVQYANRRTFTVVPGTTYNISGFFTAIGAQVMLSASQNNCYIVLEYYG